MDSQRISLLNSSQITLTPTAFLLAITMPQLTKQQIMIAILGGTEADNMLLMLGSNMNFPMLLPLYI